MNIIRNSCCFFIFFFGLTNSICYAQPYTPQTYKQYVSTQKISHQASKRITELEANQDYQSILSYTDSLAKEHPDIRFHKARAGAFAKLGDSLSTWKEAMLNIDGYPDGADKFFSQQTGIPLDRLLSYKNKTAETYLQKYYPHRDSALSERIKIMYQKDQSRRFNNPVTKTLDSLQTTYDKENAEELLQLCKERGHWLNRYLTPDIRWITIFFRHFTALPNAALLPYVIRDCEEGYSDWLQARIIVGAIQQRRIDSLNNRRLYGIALNSDGQIDIEESYMGLHIAMGYMGGITRKESTTTLQATERFTSDSYIEELERIRQFYIQQGIPAHLISIDTVKAKENKLSEGLDIYVIFRISSRDLHWYNPIYFN